MQKVFNVAVDIGRKLPAPAFDVNTNDLKSVKLLITITNGQTLLDLTDTIVRIAIRKPDNNILFQDCTIKDAKTGQVEIVLENQAYIMAGTHTAEIMCYKGNDIVAVSGTFSYKSTKGIMNNEAVESRSEFTTITGMLKDVQDTIKDVRENGTGIDTKARQDIQSVTTQLADKTSKYDNNTYFNPLRIKNGFTDSQMNNLRVKDVYNLYDSLVDGKYVTKTLLGKDQSETFDIYQYEFSPKYYTKKLVISANVHGPGDGGDPRDITISLYYFLKQVIENHEDKKHLNFIRHQCKLVIVPIVNPWGYDNSSRFNSRGVDICRNFPYRWENYTDTSGIRPKGSSPASEKETQLLKSVLDSNRDADAYIDCHAWMNKNIKFGYEFAGELNTETTNLAHNLSHYLIDKYNLSQTEMGFQNFLVEPTPSRYAYNVLNIPSGTPEFYVYVNDLPNRSEEMWTRMVEWYGNFVYLFATNSKLEDKKIGFHAHLSWRKWSFPDAPAEITFNKTGTTDTIGPSAENPLTVYEFNSPIDGYLKVSMLVVAKNANGTAASRSFVHPLVYQVGNPDYNENNGKDKCQRRFEISFDGITRQSGIMQAIIPISKRYGKIHVGLAGYVGDGSLTLYAYDCIIEIVPSMMKSDLSLRSGGWLDVAER